jgi:hypothetical protein
MSLQSRLKKLEQAFGKAPCPICRDWWKGPVVMRDETDPPFIMIQMFAQVAGGSARRD